MNKYIVYILLGIALIFMTASIVTYNEVDTEASKELVETKISFLGDGRVEYSTFKTDTIVEEVDSTTTQSYVNYTKDSVVLIKDITEDEYNELKNQIDSTFTFTSLELGISEDKDLYNGLGRSSVFGILSILSFVALIAYTLFRRK